MGQRAVDVYDEDHVAAISADIAVAIDAATFGSGSWDEVPAALSKAFPGSWGGLYNMNFPESRLNFLSFQNMDPVFVQSYAEHFAYVNPWAPYWTSLRSTTIAVSEQVLLARLFADTEFYNDWLRPQEDAEAAVGMKLVGERDEAVHVILHYPLSRSATYDRAAAEIMRRVRGNFERSIRLGRLMRADSDARVIEAALVERSSCAAFVMDGARLVREANRTAIDLFSSGHPVAIRNGRCFLQNNEADVRFALMLERLSRGMPVDGPGISFRTTAGVWQVTMVALPAPAFVSGPLSLLPPQRMVLVLLTDLGIEKQKPGNFSGLSPTFGLTPAEISLCGRLFLGESVSEAAEQLGITVETARTRLKAILQKTGTSRQGQLMLLLSRVR